MVRLPISIATSFRSFLGPLTSQRAFSIKRDVRALATRRLPYGWRNPFHELKPEMLHTQHSGGGLRIHLNMLVRAADTGSHV